VGKVDWERQLGRRVKLQALHAFCAVAELGSLSQAARYFGCSQPAISALIAELEEMVGVRLLDRSAKGVEPNIYGRALLRRWAVALDELKQGMNDIESLVSLPGGDLRIGCTEAVANAILQPIVEGFSQKYPDVALRLHYAQPLMPQLGQLRDRNIDICLARWRETPIAEGDFEVEVLFNDEVVVAASKSSRWAQCARVELDELINESWILTPPDSWNYAIMAEAFRRRELVIPKPFLMTYSVPLRVNLAASGAHIAALPASVLRCNPANFGLTALPVELPQPDWPVAIVTLKNRVLGVAAQLFCAHVRTVAKALAAQTIVENESKNERTVAQPDAAMASSFWL
jgi:DNA-binding transcriptional LysR family regulator